MKIAADAVAIKKKFRNKESLLQIITVVQY